MPNVDKPVMSEKREPELAAVQYRFWYPNSAFGNAISWFSSGPFSHVSMVVNGVEFEAVTDMGVVASHPAPFKASDGEVKVVMKHVSEVDEVFEFLQELAGNRGKPRVRYAKKQLLNFFMPWLKVKDKGYYCSELAYKASRHKGWIKSVRKREIDPTDMYLMVSQIQ